MKIALFANHKPGVDIASYFASIKNEDQIEALYLPGQDENNDNIIISQSRLNHKNIFTGKEIIKNQDHIKWFKDQKFDAIICVYWPWLLSNEIFESVGITVNFHPALLPINRGWFPHVHSLIDGSKAGVTIHKIEDGADTGAVWAQEEVIVKPTDTAKSLYDTLQLRIVDLFKNNWDAIKSGKCNATFQDESNAIYRPKKAIESLDYIDLEKEMKVKDLLNLLRARSFGNLGFAYIEVEGKKVYLNLRLSEQYKF
jgi:methionyl-tRNA formyltransferase